MGHTTGPVRARAARGSAKHRLRAAAGRLFAEATLDDLAAFATVDRLSSRAALSSGAIYSAYPSTPGVDRTAPQSAMRDAYLALGIVDDEIVRGVAELFDSTIASPEDASLLIEKLADLVADPIVDGARNPDRWSYSHVLLGATVAVNDTEVAEMLAEHYLGVDEMYGYAVATVLEITGRAPVGGMGARDIARLLVAASDGAALRLRIDPNIDGSLVTTMLLGVFAAMTRRIDEEDDLFARRITVAGERSLDDDRLDDVATSVRRIESTEGWPAVTLPRVAELAGIAEVSLVAAFPTRHHLATLVWDDVVDRVGRRAASRVEMEPDAQLVELVADLAEAACSQRLLVASMLIARLHAVSTDSNEVTADRAVALLADLLPVAAEVAWAAARTSVDALMMGAAGSDIGADELARLLTVGLAPVSAAVTGTTSVTEVPR